MKEKNWAIVLIIAVVLGGLILIIAYNKAYPQEMKSTNIRTIYKDSCSCHKEYVKPTLESKCLKTHCLDTLEQKMLVAWLREKK